MPQNDLSQGQGLGRSSPVNPLQPLKNFKK